MNHLPDADIRADKFERTHDGDCYAAVARQLREFLGSLPSPKHGEKQILTKRELPRWWGEEVEKPLFVARRRDRQLGCQQPSDELGRWL